MNRNAKYKMITIDYRFLTFIIISYSGLIMSSDDYIINNQYYIHIYDYS